ncbi:MULTISPECIES: CGNR zinc finger domain-containing protein [unclassified Nocardioides]|uniref:CGNR zinc finger domain-containing protein n=1 Tax=unclassified Nocardioides TaxID=2615069 RepID=UPI00361DD76A
MTGQLHFDSHVRVLTDVTCGLVNALTPGYDGGHPHAVPEDPAAAVGAVLRRDDYRPAVSRREGDEFVVMATRLRSVFEATDRSDTASAVAVVNEMLDEFGTRPRLDPAAEGGWTLHFHGSDAGLVVGWGAGVAVGLAMAIGSGLAGRIGVCSASPCDRVYVDSSRNGGRRFCSPRCQSRVKAAAHRARARQDQG